MKKQSSTIHDLLKIADKLPGLIKLMDKPPDKRLSLIGRAAGVKNDRTALFEMVIDLARHGYNVSDDQVDSSSDGDNDHWSEFCMVQAAINFCSNDLWEKLWNEKHPDRYGRAWDDDAEDFALMDVWRTKVRQTLKECHQDFVLDMTYDEYIAKLIDGGAEEDVAKYLADSFLTALHTEEEQRDYRA